MKLIKLIFLLFALVPILIVTSCGKKDIYIDLTSSNWEVVKIKKQGESSYTKAEESYILKFTDKQTYNVNLDVNECFGEYNIKSSGNIYMSTMGCTEICCDSEFALSFSELLPKMTSFYGNGDELIFEGEGKIILKEK